MKIFAKIKSLWVIIASIGTTVYASILTIQHCIIYKNSRQWVDQHARAWAKSMLKIVKANYRLHNPHSIDIRQYERCILISNHNSLYDIPVIFATLPGSIRMLAKIELSKIPIFGKALLKAEFPFVDRRKGRQAIQALKSTQQLIDSGIIPWVSPEGTRAQSAKLGRLKKGSFILAIKSQATIIPIGIRNTEKILPPNTLQFKFNQTIDLHIGKPIYTGDYTLKTIDQLMALAAHQLRALKGEAKVR